MNATLPHDKQSKTISGMFPGETGFSTPWAVVVDLDRQLWVRGDYAFSETKHGTSCMKIHRSPEGYEVDFPQNYIRLAPQPLTELNHTDWNLQPVTKAEWKQCAEPRFGG